MSQANPRHYREEEAEVQPSPLNFQNRLTRRLFLNRAAEIVVRAGGGAIIFCILAIFVVIFLEAWPLFKSSRAVLEKELPAHYSESPVYLGSDETNSLMFGIQPSGQIIFTPLDKGREVKSFDVSLPEGVSIVSAAKQQGSNHYFLGRNDGLVSRVEISFRTEFQGNDRSVLPEPRSLDPWVIQNGLQVENITSGRTSAGMISAFLLASKGGEQSLVIRSLRERKSLMGSATGEEHSVSLDTKTSARITALELASDASVLYLGTSAGQLLVVDVRNAKEPQVIARHQISDKNFIAVSAIRLLIGGMTLVTGTSSGEVTSWMFVDGTAITGGQLVPVHKYPSHTQAVTNILRSERNRTFVSVDGLGQMFVNYGTTGESLISLSARDEKISLVSFSPKGDNLLLADTKGGVKIYFVDNPHPEASLQALFGKIWYEGYKEPTFVWQSSSGSDEFEPKLSLAPLIYGTLKGTFYSLLFAVPIAVLAALYTAEFMSVRMKAVVKPIIELMAALPSVVLGFIAGLWLAPLLSTVVPGVFLLPIVIALSTFVALFAFRRLPLSWRLRFSGGQEIYLLVPLMMLSLWLAFVSSHFVETNFMGGSFQDWLMSAFGVGFDQRNCLVVGIVMGFAVIPLIFTISEDSIAIVPGHLRAASLALGASRWQTAMRVVLPAASPGIFSAIMLGFGRAVGETMIVLMATGNTPVMDPSIFSGLRALSANIAVELPEAAVDSTLFRILFLAALLLFCMTFVVNTATELIRIRLRARYGQH